MKASITRVSLALACLALAACAGRLPIEEGVYQVNGANSEHPRLRYLDGHVSANETCMIRVENSIRIHGFLQKFIDPWVDVSFSE